MAKVIRQLGCCVCGEDRFEQDWNRDTGFGICRNCVDWLKSITGNPQMSTETPVDERGQEDATSEPPKTIAPIVDSMDAYLRKSAEGKTGIFRDHSCSKCQDGAKPCVRGQPNWCEYPHARND